jgi:hypothetical protein
MTGFPVRYETMKKWWVGLRVMRPVRSLRSWKELKVELRRSRSSGRFIFKRELKELRSTGRLF